MSKNLINCSVAVFFFFIWLALKLSGLTADWSQPAQTAMILLLVTAFLWITELVPLFLTSFVVLLIETVWLFPQLKASGVEGVSKNIFLSPFFSDIILLFMGGFVLSDLLNRYGISRWIMVHLLGRELAHPSRMVLMLMLISAFFSMWISNTATTAMTLALISPLLAVEGISENIKRLMPISVAFACNIGGLATPIGTPPNAIVLTYLNKAGIYVSFFSWMLIMLPFVIIMLFFIWKLLVKLYPVDALPSGAINTSAAIQGGITGKQKAVCAIFLATVAGWMTTGLHPLTNGEVSIAMITVVFGFGLLRTEDFKNLSWNILIILGGGLALGVGVEVSGLAKNLVAIAPAESPSELLAMLLSLCAVLSTFISNTAAANLIAPLSVNLGELRYDILLGIAIFCSTSMSMAISTPPNVLASAMGGLRFKDLFIPGVAILFMAALLFIPVLFYSKLILGI